MSVEIVTYVNNQFDVPVKVLGWSRKWNGFGFLSTEAECFVTHINSIYNVLRFCSG